MVGVFRLLNSHCAFKTPSFSVSSHVKSVALQNITMQQLLLQSPSTKNNLLCLYYSLRPQVAWLKKGYGNVLKLLPPICIRHIKLSQCFSVLLLGPPCPACFRCFPSLSPTHLIKMDGSLSGFCRAWRQTDHLNQVCWSWMTRSVRAQKPYIFKRVTPRQLKLDLLTSSWLGKSWVGGRLRELHWAHAFSSNTMEKLVV